MTIPLPELDQRTWADLVEEAVAAAPIFAPAWTDQNAHDPGITLIELLAYKIEQSIYRANRVTAAMLWRFLTLAGPGALPAGLRAAKADVTFRLTEDVSAERLAAGLLFLVRGNATAPMSELIAMADPSAAPLRLRHELFVHPLSIRAVQTSDGSGSFSDVTKLWQQEIPFPAWGENPIDSATGTAALPYPPALYLGLDRLPEPCAPLCVRVALDQIGPPRDERARLAAALASRARSRNSAAGRTIAVSSNTPPAPGECWTGLPSDCGTEQVLPGDDPPALVAWEYWNGSAWIALLADDPTRGLTLDGTVRLTIPESAEFTGDSTRVRRLVGEVPIRLSYIRCRLVRGRPDVSPPIARIDVNTVEVDQIMPVVTKDLSKVIGPCLEPMSSAVNADSKNQTYEDVDIDEFAWRYLSSLDGRRTSGKPVCNDSRKTSGPVMEFGTGPGDAPLKATKVRVWSLDSNHGLYAARVLMSGDPLNDGSTVLKLTDAPVVAPSVRLVSMEPDDGNPPSWTLRFWTPAPTNDLEGMLPTDAVYTLDPGSGAVTFGNGVVGRAVPAGTLFLAKYDITSASQGNPSPRVMWDLVGAVSTAVKNSAAVNPGPLSYKTVPLADWNTVLWRANRMTALPPLVPFEGVSLASIASDPARAGTGAEPLDDAIARLAASTGVHKELAGLAAANGGTLDGLGLVNLLNQPVPRQAVTPADLERLALDTPGASVLRARAFAETDSELPGLAASGTVTLVIVPGLPTDKPSPSANLVRRVNAHLQPIRGLGTRLRLIGPVYASRNLSATLRVKPGFDPSTVKADATHALYDWLDPLGTGGENGSGPPVFGIDIIQAEVLTKLAAVSGVSEVDDLTLDAGPGPPILWTAWTLPTWGTITLNTEDAT
jgi:hypothetical protein